jgi:hypothetical protein
MQSAPWYRACADDIRAAKRANFFCRVADFTETFLDFEAQALAIHGIGGGKRGGKPRREAAKSRRRNRAALSRRSAWPNRK